MITISIRTGNKIDSKNFSVLNINIESRESNKVWYICTGCPFKHEDSNDDDAIIKNKQFF